MQLAMLERAATELIRGRTFSESYKRPESVLVVVYAATGETLLLKRCKPMFWQSVTGSLDWPNETPADAARREVYEETGIELETGWTDWKISRYFPILPEYRDRFPPETRLNKEYMFSLRLDETCSVVLAPDEHDSFEWISLLEAKSRVWSWTNRAALDQIKALDSIE